MDGDQDGMGIGIVSRWRDGENWTGNRWMGERLTGDEGG